MATVCTACGTENRDKARYCRGCARPLVPLGAPGASADTPAEAATPHQKTRRSRSRARRAARRRRNAIRWGLGAVVLMAGLLVWWLWPGASTSEAALAASATPAPPVETPAPAAPAWLVTGTTPVDSVTRTATTAPKTTGPQAAPSTPVATQPPRTKPTPTRPKTATTAAAPTPEPVRSEPVAPTPVAEAPPTPVVAPRPRGVDETCADRGNFFSRDLCRIQACGNPALAGDPVCVRFREMEAANRSRASN